MHTDLYSFGGAYTYLHIEDSLEVNTIISDYIRS